MINGSESFELKDGSSNVIDKTSSGTDSQINVEGSLDTFTKDKRYERIDVNAYNWKMYSGDYASATPGVISSDNQTDSSLPVELSSWNATSTKGYVTLTWTTESEIENQGFILERRLAGETSLQELSSFADNPQLLGQGSTTARNTYTYTDKAVTTGQTYTYQLSDVDYSGKLTKHTAISVTVKAFAEDLKPGSMVLHSAYPNPFNPSTIISFTMAGETHNDASVQVYDINGRFVKSLFSGATEPGDYTVKWNGSTVASGVYFIRLASGNDVQIQRVTLLR